MFWQKLKRFMILLPNSAEKLKKIRIVVLDVDGVLTDGLVGYSSDAEEVKFFNIKDGQGIKLLQQAGLKVGILSGRESKANQRRASELALDFAYQGSADKGHVFTQLLQDLDADAGECLYMGDDLPDLAVFGLAGFSVAVQDAVAPIKEAADYVTEKCGGRGAVREMAEYLLSAKGVLNDLIGSYKVVH